MIRSSTLLASVAALALAAPWGAASASPTRTLTGSVGPGFTISLTAGGRKVTKLKAGSYRVVVKDRASAHDFHLTGPGVDRVITGVSFTGTKSAVLTLKKGTYRYVCDPHATLMKGSFKVV